MNIRQGVAGEMVMDEIMSRIDWTEVMPSGNLMKYGIDVPKLVQAIKTLRLVFIFRFSYNWFYMKMSLKDAEENLRLKPSKLFIKLFEHGTLSVEFYKPGASDLQTPHQQDELYVITSGTGVFIHENRRDHVIIGDLIFVPAGDSHRFENYTEDFATWVIFYGKKGGEKSYAG